MPTPKLNECAIHHVSENVTSMANLCQAYVKSTPVAAAAEHTSAHTHSAAD